MVGVSATIRQTAQVLGPVFGGLITHTFGFRAIFWFLTIVGGVVFIMIMVFLPETLPSIAGDGTVRLRGIHKPFFYRLKAQPSVYDEKSNIPTNPIRLQAFFSPILSLLQPDVFIIMFSGGIIYAIHNMVTSSTTALLKPRFGLTDQQTGLVFLPNGCGVILGSFIWGKILDRNWKFYEKDYRSTRGMMDTQTLDHSRLEDFPVERARLHWHWWLFSAFTAAVTAYGFSLSTKSLPFVLVLQSLIAITSQAVFTTCSALAIDLYPSAAASATALQNLVRCALGAVGVAVVDLMLARLGESLTYSLCGSLVLLLWPLLIVEWMHGSEWRQERLRRSREKAALADDAERKE